MSNAYSPPLERRGLDGKPAYQWLFHLRVQDLATQAKQHVEVDAIQKRRCVASTTLFACTMLRHEMTS
jgi:hypothetical protein